MKKTASIFALMLLVCFLVGVPARGEGTLGDADTDEGVTQEAADGEVLKVKCTGQKVVDLQMRLRDLGYFNYKVTGYYGTATADAVRLFQEQNGLTVDGTVGPETRKVLYSPNAKRYTAYPSQAASYLPASRGGRTSMGVLVEWFSEGQYLFPRGAVAKVIDLYTGRSFYMKRSGGINHADSEPLTEKDAQAIKEIWGGWSWNRRPVIVEIGGVRVAASMHGMPHAYDTIPNNGMQGHVCIHFYRSRTHIHNREDPDHQAAVMRAAGR